MPDNQNSWALESAQDVAEALDWLRRRMGAGGLLVVAIGPNSVAYAKDPKLAPADAEALLQGQLEAGTLRRGFEDLKQMKTTRAARKREDV